MIKGGVSIKNNILRRLGLLENQIKTSGLMWILQDGSEVRASGKYDPLRFITWKLDPDGKKPDINPTGYRCTDGYIDPITESIMEASMKSANEGGACN